MVAQDAVLLKPKGMGELFDQAIRLYRKHFIKFVGIVAVAQIPIEIVRLLGNFIAYGMLTTQGVSDSPSMIWMQSSAQTLPTLIASLLSFILVTGLAEAALTTAILKSYMGEEVSIESAYRQIRGRWLSLLGAVFLLMLFNIPVLIWSIIPCIGWFTGLGIFFFITLVLNPLLAPIVIIERRPAGQALRRAWDLTRRRFWWVCGYFVLLVLFGLLVVTGPVSVLNGVLVSQMPNWITTDNVNNMIIYRYAIQSIVNLIMNLLYLPLAGTCAALVYFDLRVRQEGFDLALQANEASETPLTASELASQSPALETTNIITMKEMGYFAGLSFAGLALYFIPVMLLTILIMALAPGGF